jgi:chloramphenicol O-acetyltransferase
MRQRRADSARRAASAGYQIIPYPKYLRFAAAAYQTVRHRPVIHGLLEVDVTDARAALRAHQAATGERLSFTAFIAACLARAVDEHKAVQAFRQGSKRLVIFDDVDVANRVEREVSGRKIVVTAIIRAANRKTIRQIHDEIRVAQRGDANPMLTRFRLLSALPTPLYSAAARVFALLANQWPALWKDAMGTVDLTAVGMFAQGAGWGIPLPAPNALILTVGGIAERQVLVDGRASVREYLSLTISVNHEVVDGAPAARFAQRLKELIESGYGLSEAVGERAGAVNAEKEVTRSTTP